MLVVIGILLKILIVVGITQGAVAYLICVERKVAAYAQDRIGPNRAGREFGIPFGLLQPLADGAKMLLKEDVIPGYVNKPLYMLAPIDRDRRRDDRLRRRAVRPGRPGRRRGIELPDRARTSTSASSTSSRSAAWRSTG